MNKKLWTIIGLGLIWSFPVYSGDLNIYADKQVEVHQNEQKLVALGNAKATQDGRTVIADKLTAYYQKRRQEKPLLANFRPTATSKPTFKIQKPLVKK